MPTLPDVLKEKYQDTMDAEDWADYCRTISQDDFRFSEKVYFNLGEVEGRKHALAWVQDVEKRIGQLKDSLA